MVQIESLSTPECQEGVPSPGGQQEEEHRLVLHVQLEYYQKKSQDHKPKSKFLSLFLSTTSLVDSVFPPCPITALGIVTGSVVKLQ